MATNSVEQAKVRLGSLQGAIESMHHLSALSAVTPPSHFDEMAAIFQYLSIRVHTEFDVLQALLNRDILPFAADMKVTKIAA